VWFLLVAPTSGWWFGTWILFSPTRLGMMIQSDFHIFQGGWNHQVDIFADQQLILVLLVVNHHPNHLFVKESGNHPAEKCSRQMMIPRCSMVLEYLYNYLHLPQKWPSLVGFYIPGPWFASGMLNEIDDSSPSPKLVSVRIWYPNKWMAGGRG